MYPIIGCMNNIYIINHNSKNFQFPKPGHQYETTIDKTMSGSQAQEPKKSG